MELIEFKAGNKHEIRQSLANYCQVPIGRINRNSIKEIYEKYKNECHGISDALWKKFNPYTPRETQSTFKVYRYHKTGTNGQKEWFSKGLLGQDRGIRNYIRNLYKFYDLDFSKFEERLASECIEKNILDKDDGPYAFMCYKNAEEHHGFNASEVLEDVRCDEMFKLRRLAEAHLLPTVVIFWVQLPIEQLDAYLLCYCEMLLEIHSEYSSLAINKDIPFENIECIKMLPKLQKKPHINNYEFSGTHIFSPVMPNKALT